MAVFVNKLRSKSIIIKPLPVLVLFPSLSRQNPQFHQSSLSPLSRKQKMETPLITEERINPVLEGGSKGKQYRRRSDAIAFGDRYQKAAALVDLAEDGIGIPEEVLGDARFERAGKYYFWYIRFNWLWSLNLFALVLLNFLEKQPGVSRLVLVGTKQPRQKPLWCWKDDYSCQERDTFYLGELPYLEKKQAVFYEGITFALLVLQIFAPLAYEGLMLYWKNSMNKLKVGLLFILACDIVVYGSFSSPLPFRLAPYIRVVFLILTSRYLLTCTVTLVGLLGQYLNILALWLLFLIFASWLAYVMFEDTLQGKTIFTSYGTTLYQMFVLFTTSNNPDVWIPAYRQIFRKAINIVGGYILRNSRWSSLFFVLYVLLGVYFVTNLILAVVYDSFKEQFARQIMEMDSMRNRILKKAFNLVDTNNRNYLDKDQCISLFEALNKYRTLPKTSKEDYEFIFDELDRSGDFKINLEEFAELCNAIALKFQKEPAPPFLEKYPAFYRSYPCEKLKSFVRSRYFEYCVALVLLLNLIAVVIETTLDITNSSGQKVWQKIEFFLGWVYVVEMALKIFSLGFDAYWMEGQNKFDFIITWTIFIGETLTFAFPSKLSFLSNGEWIRYLLIARMLRLIRLLLQVKRFRAFVATFLNLIPSLAPYLGMIFCVLCFYCSLGLQLFGGIVNSQNPKLQDTGLYDNDYVLFNFNDYPNGMVTLFNLVVMGNWQVWMESYAELTGTSWTLVYFISFYLVTTLLLLNLILAFVLEAFFAEIDIEKTPEDCGEDTGDTRPSRRRAARARSTMVDRLLHHMFSDELTQCPKP